MKTNEFYEREEVIHEVVEAQRSKLCYNLIIKLITENMDNEEQKRILDIGYYSILEAKCLGSNDTVISIEPIQRNFQYLLKNFKLNNINNVRPLNVALSDNVGIIRMIVDEGSS